MSYKTLDEISNITKQIDNFSNLNIKDQKEYINFAFDLVKGGKGSGQKAKFPIGTIKTDSKGHKIQKTSEGWKFIKTDQKPGTKLKSDWNKLSDEGKSNKIEDAKKKLETAKKEKDKLEISGLTLWLDKHQLNKEG